jgi:hypothetical protein
VRTRAEAVLKAESEAVRLLMGRLSALGLIVFLMVFNGSVLRDPAAQFHADGLSVVGVNYGLVRHDCTGLL